MGKERSSPLVYSKTRQPHMSGLPPCTDCDCACCCKEIISQLSTDFLGAQQVGMSAGWPALDFSGSDPFSIAFWVKWEDSIHGPPAAKSIVVARTGYDVGDVSTTGYSVAVDSTGQVLFGLWGEARGDNSDPNAYAAVTETGTPVFTGAWFHVAATYDGSGSPSGMNVYINGTAGTLTPAGSGVNSTTIQPTNNAQMEMGREQDTTGAWVNYAKLRIAEFMMFGIELSTDDVAHLCGSAYGTLCNGPVQLEPSKETCPGDNRVWYRMGDDTADYLITTPHMNDNGPGALHGTPGGYVAPGLFEVDAPPTCDCSGYGTEHIWEFDTRNDYVAYMPAQTGVTTSDSTIWNTAEVNETRSEARLLFLNVDGSQPGGPGGTFYDHSPNPWFGSVGADVHAANAQNAMSHMFAQKEIALLNQTQTQLDVYWMNPITRAITNKNAAAGFPPISDVKAIGVTQTQHPTTGQPGLIVIVVSSVNPANTSTFWYDPAADAWTSGPTCPRAMVAGSCVASHHGSTITYIGIGSSHWIEQYDSATAQWTQLTTPANQVIFKMGSSMAVDPATGDVWAILWDDGWQLWQYDLSNVTWVQHATPPDPFLGITQQMHLTTDRVGNDFRLIVASFNTSKWSLYTPSTNTWSGFRAPPSIDGTVRWWKSGHLATLVPRS